jgi:iron(III) transport system ATP-binding protein
VLDGLDLSVAPGTFVSILGPSGSGKTTLLRIIAGFERPNRGRVTLGGRVVDDEVTHVPPERRQVGYVPQDGSLFPHLTVEDNVGFGLARRERRGQKTRLLLGMVGLDGLEKRYPHQLSGGQQQRVALARALAVRPTLLLLDEPFASLDAGLRSSVRRDVRRVLADAGTTTVLVTHDQDEALSLSDQVATIERGRVGQFGDPAAVYSRPLSPSLAQALGQANLLPGTARGATVETALGLLPLERPESEGTRLLVLVRPEQVVLGPAGPYGQIVGHVLEREYYGHDAVVRVGTKELPGTPVTARAAGGTSIPEVGSRVGLSVQGNVVAWPDGS